MNRKVEKGKLVASHESAAQGTWGCVMAGLESTRVLLVAIANCRRSKAPNRREGGLAFAITLRCCPFASQSTVKTILDGETR